MDNVLPRIIMHKFIFGSHFLLLVLAPLSPFLGRFFFLVESDQANLMTNVSSITPLF